MLFRRDKLGCRRVQLQPGRGIENPNSHEHQIREYRPAHDFLGKITY